MVLTDEHWATIIGDAPSGQNTSDVTSIHDIIGRGSDEEGSEDGTSEGASPESTNTVVQQFPAYRLFSLIPSQELSLLDVMMEPLAISSPVQTNPTAEGNLGEQL